MGNGEGFLRWALVLIAVIAALGTGTFSPFTTEDRRIDRIEESVADIRQEVRWIKEQLDMCQRMKE